MGNRLKMKKFKNRMKWKNEMHFYNSLGKVEKCEDKKNGNFQSSRF